MKGVVEELTRRIRRKPQPPIIAVVEMSGAKEPPGEHEYNCSTCWCLPNTYETADGQYIRVHRSFEN